MGAACLHALGGRLTAVPSRRPASVAIAAALVLTAACVQVYDDVACDDSIAEINFSPVAAWAGTWCGNGNPGLTFDADARPRLIDPAVTRFPVDGAYEDRFGCEPGEWPLVFGQSTTKGGKPLGGSFGDTGNGATRTLETATVHEGRAFLRYHLSSPEQWEDEFVVFLLEQGSEANTIRFRYATFPVDEAEPSLEWVLEADDSEFTFDYELVRCEG